MKTFPQDSCSALVQRCTESAAGDGQGGEGNTGTTDTRNIDHTCGSSKRDFFGEAFMVNACIIKVDRPNVFHKTLIPKKI